jgi:alkylation response protein AidB-like acyl-CoA dehydrogenase
MDITLSESERTVRDGARHLLAREVTAEYMQAAHTAVDFPAELWQKLADTGWLGVAVKDSATGYGGSLVHWALVLEEMGRVACPAPVAEHMSAVAYLAAVSAADDERLAGAAAGRLIVTIAHEDKPGSAVSAGPTQAGIAELRGTKMLVPYALGASHILVVAGTDDSRAYYWLDATAPGVILTPVKSLSKNQQCLLELDGAEAELLGTYSDDPRRDLIELFTLAGDAYAVGLMGTMLDTSLGYVKQRVQFDQPIGRFQAVQHRCADMAVAYSGAQSLLYNAAWLVDNDKPAVETLALCHAYGRDAAGIVLGNAHQVHGGIGFTKEYPLHHFSRRAKVYEVSLGQAASHRERWARLQARPAPGQTAPGEPERILAAGRD